MTLQLVLASASPRRRELLTQAGYRFAVEAADLDESLREGEAAAVYVERLAREKAQAIFARHQSERDTAKGAEPGPERSPCAPSMTVSSSWVGSADALSAPLLPLLVVGADTCVVVGDGPAEEILGKPADAADARRMLRRLSDRTHRVLTGIAVASSAGVSSAVETTAVTFAPIPEDELDLYCATPEPLDKAGAYGIQGYAARWVPRIEGCYFNVMGLPIARTVRLIEEALALAR